MDSQEQTEFAELLVDGINAEMLEFGTRLPDKLRDLDLPWREFSTLLAFIKRRQAFTLGKPARNSLVASMLYSKNEAFLISVLAKAGLALAMMSLIAAPFISWWLMLGPPLGFSLFFLASLLRCKFVERTALSSEKVFCWLFCIGLIEVVDTSDGAVYRFNIGSEMKAENARKA